MKQKISKFKDAILNLIYPKNIKCMFCTGELNQNSYNTTCEDCLNNIPFVIVRCLSDCADDSVNSVYSFNEETCAKMCADFVENLVNNL